MRQSFLAKALLALFHIHGMMIRTAGALEESMTDRMMRLKFVEEMERLEMETLRRKRQESLQKRLLKVAREVLSQSFFPAETTDRSLAYDYYQNQNNDDYLHSYVYSNNENIDLAGYALKYVGCQNVHTWDDNLVDGSSTPLAMNRFVVFRLCKANDCSAYNKLGCNYNYGEYVLPMEDYLSIMAEYHFEQFGRFCKTCHRCMRLDYYKDDDGVDDAYNATDDGMGDDTYCDINSDDCSDDEYWAGKSFHCVFDVFFPC